MVILGVNLHVNETWWKWCTNTHTVWQSSDSASSWGAGSGFGEGPRCRGCCSKCLQNVIMQPKLWEESTQRPGCKKWVPFIAGLTEHFYLSCLHSFLVMIWTTNTMSPCSLPHCSLFPQRHVTSNNCFNVCVCERVCVSYTCMYMCVQFCLLGDLVCRFPVFSLFLESSGNSMWSYAYIILKKQDRSNNIKYHIRTE